jgi:prophage DNA circulation protein
MTASGEAAEEVLAIIDRIGPVVLSAAVNVRGKLTRAAALRRSVGILMADRNTVNIQVFVYAFGICLDLARESNATLVTMDRIRKAALLENPISPEAVQTVLAMVRLTLAAEARILSLMTFRSREEAEAIATAFNAAFEQTITIAADDLDQGTYLALIHLHADVVQHLASVGRQLPRIIAYQFQAVLPALRLAQRAYNDATRYFELIDENRVVHPAFMPREGKMLAV